MIKKVKSMSGFYRLLKEVNELKNPIFRGHSSVKYELKSSSFRRLENKYKDILKVGKNLSLYHGQLIEEFKENKYHQSQIGELTDLEILAKLQHYGAATCFMDFSKNIAVALWFACSSKENVDGRVYILKNTQDVLSYKRINSTQLKYNIGKFYEDYLSDEKEDIKENELTKYFLLWEPPYLSERILQQDSIFLFSKKEFELDSEIFLHRVDIDKTLKKDILKILNKLFNINKKNIYKDFHGFASSHAQNEEIDFIDDGIKYFEIANQYYQADEYEKALEFYQKAMDDGIDDKNVLIEIYENIANIYEGKYTTLFLKEALEYQIKAVVLKENFLGIEHPELATSYNNLSSIYQELGGKENLGKALEYQTKAIEIKEKVLVNNHPSLATSYNNLSIIYKDLGGKENLGKALEYQIKAVEMREKVLGNNHPSLGTNYNNLSMIYKVLGGDENLGKALEYQTKSIEIKEKVLGNNHSDLATSYNNLSSIYKALGGDENLNEALKYQIKAVEISEKVLGNNHPFLATSYNNLSSIYKALGGDESLKEALTYIDKSITIFKGAFPDGHTNLEIFEENRKSLIDEMNK